MNNDYWQLKNNKTEEIVEIYQGAQWIDEFDWSAVAQSDPVILLDGDQFVQQGFRKSGRLISLGGENCFAILKDVRKLRSWTDIPELEMTLTHYNGDEYEVSWRLHEKPLAAQPYGFYETPEEDDDPYLLQLNLMEI